MQIGGVTVFGLPAELPIWVDARVMDARADRPRRRLAVVEGHRRRRRSCARCPASRSSRGSPTEPPPGPRHGRLASAGASRTRRRVPTRAASTRRVGRAARPDEPVDPNADPTPPRRPRPTGPIQYKGDDLEPARGPGLGCFRFQLIVLVVFIVLTPLTVVWGWPPAVSAALLFARIVLLLLTGPDDHLPAPARRRRPPGRAGRWAAPRRRSASSRIGRRRRARPGRADGRPRTPAARRPATGRAPRPRDGASTSARPACRQKRCRSRPAPVPFGAHPKPIDGRARPQPPLGAPVEPRARPDASAQARPREPRPVRQ